MRLNEFIDTLDERIQYFEGYVEKQGIKSLSLDDWISSFSTFRTWGDEDDEEEDEEETGWEPGWD